MTFNDWIGTVGVSLILLAFFCSTFKLIKSDGKLFYLLNIVGAALACYASYLINYTPFIILEATWTLVSIVGFVKAIRRNKP